jgi:hypothetical protein
MASAQKPPETRPAFRTLALVTAIVLFLLAVVLRLVTPELGLFPPFACLAVGFILLVGVAGLRPLSSGAQARHRHPSD